MINIKKSNHCINCRQKKNQKKNHNRPHPPKKTSQNTKPTTFESEIYYDIVVVNERVCCYIVNLQSLIIKMFDFHKIRTYICLIYLLTSSNLFYPSKKLRILRLYCLEAYFSYVTVQIYVKR